MLENMKTSNAIIKYIKYYINIKYFMLIMKKLPIELKLEILSFLPLISFIKILKKREIFDKLFNRKNMGVSNLIANAIFDNLFNYCYLCKNTLAIDYYLNMCFKCTTFIDKEQFFYKICNNCYTYKKNNKKVTICDCSFCNTKCIYLKTHVYS